MRSDFQLAFPRGDRGPQAAGRDSNLSISALIAVCAAGRAPRSRRARCAPAAPPVRLEDLLPRRRREPDLGRPGAASRPPRRSLAGGAYPDPVASVHGRTSPSPVSPSGTRRFLHCSRLDTGVRTRAREDCAAASPAPRSTSSRQRLDRAAARPGRLPSSALPLDLYRLDRSLRFLERAAFSSSALLENTRAGTRPVRGSSRTSSGRRRR